MHEILIAVGIGLWFSLWGVLCYVFISKSYKKTKNDSGDKK